MIDLENKKECKEEIIKKYIKFVKKNGRKPKTKEYDPEYNLPDMGTIRKYFGGTRSLYKICETEVSKFEEMEFEKGKRLATEKVKKFLEREKTLPKQSDYRERKNDLPTIWEVRKYFGSIGKLNEECTGKKMLVARKMTKEELILSIQEFYRINDRLPGIKEFSLKNNMPTYRMIKKYYKGITELKNAAGFEIAKREKYDKKKIMKKFKEFVGKTGRKPSKEEYMSKYNLPDMGTIVKHYGSMESFYKAYEVAGGLKFEEIKRNKIKEEIVEKVKKFMKREGRFPSPPDYYVKNSIPNRSVVRKYFKSVDDLYVACTGEKKVRFSKMTKEDLILSVQEFYRINGRLPMKKEFILKNNLPSPNMVKKHYGGISELKNAAGFEIIIPGKKVTEEEIIRSLKDFYEREGRSPKAQEMTSKYGLP